MRPIVLDMNGFASFREAATVDFTDADFFALVGPTGSGKSTVIDAMTFALYGSVPRWGHRGMVSLALAPTVDRGTVKLVFEVEGHRYVVARELRRVGGKVGQRAASLERLTDAGGLAQPGDPTEVLAKDLAGVSEAVERLLGLSYDDFCQCVVLPQGQFANFLHATPGDRQEILLRLLGAEHFRKMMMAANQRADNAAQRANAHAETLATLADATQEAEAAARAAEAALTTLADRVDAALPLIRAAEQDLAAAESELARLDAERAALTAVRVPDDVPALDAGLSAARGGAVQARSAHAAAEDADRTARDALASGPQRAPLVLARQRRADHGEHSGREPALREDVARLSGQAAQAQAVVGQAAAALEELRGQREEVAREHETAQRQVQDLGAEHARLAAVAAPPGTDQLDDAHRAAIDAAREATEVLVAAEQADSDERAARNSAVSPGSLEHSLRDLSDLGTILADLVSARARLDQARADQATADSALVVAESAKSQAEQDLDAARRANVAADLRPHLEPGHACPVCDQVVVTLPAAVDAPGMGEALTRSEAAAAAVTKARAVAVAAGSAHDRARSDLAAAAVQRARRIASLTAALAGPLAGAALEVTAELLTHEASPVYAEPGAGEAEPGADEAQAGRAAAAVSEVQAALQERHRLDAAAETAGTAVESARTGARAAQARLDRAITASAAGRSALSAARDPLVGLGAPSIDDVSLAAGWARLSDWAASQAQARALRLDSARAGASSAADQLASKQATFDHAETALSALRTDATDTAKAEQEGRTRLAELTDRIAELGQLLDGAPADEEITAQLALLAGLEEAALQADRRLAQARSDRTSSDQALADLELAEAAARNRLSDARDPLVRLGAPALASPGAGLLTGWAELAAWAAAEAAARDQAIAAATQRVATGQAGVAGLTGQLSADLAACGLELEPDTVAGAAAAATSGALADARSATRWIVERRKQAAELIGRRDAEQDEQQVARMLGDLLRSNRFPRWLVTAAIDVLVADASANLAGLSDGQFDLTHEDGDFYVIDHTDADSRRSVRTLSGGETFQASLALALALSSQLTALAAAGSARLDSIFLDEGFGTLDPETLDVVAATLESLAQGQRMVGIITHVAALAERVPVRFAVSRDARTSRVVREALPAGDPA